MKFRYIALVGTVFLLIGAFAFQPTAMLGQNSSVSTMNPWKLVSGVISPRSDTADIKIPSLASSGDCLVTDASGNITATACGTGSYPDYLSQVGDVSTTTLATGYVLKWSGTEWESVATSTLNISATALLTPWTSAINGAGYALTNAGAITGTYFTATSTTASQLPYASSTNLTATNLWNTNASSTWISAARFYGALTGNASTATALASNGGNCSAGNAPLGVDASGAVESCFDVWTEAENTSAGYTSYSDTDTNAYIHASTTIPKTYTANTFNVGTTTIANLDVTTGIKVGSDYITDITGTGLTLAGGVLSATGGTSHATSSITVCALSTCDYVTDGTADEVQINQALSQASSTGGVVQLFAQTYNVSSAILLRGLTANSVSNPAISLYGMGQDATNIVGAPNINVIEITNEPKFNIANMTLSIKGTGDGINQVAGTERGNWLSHIDNVNIISDFTTVTSDSWGIYMESPFRMRFTNIEMNGVANGMWLKGHTDAFNPGNLSVDRIFIDLWNDASVSGAIGIKLSNSGTSGTNHFNLTSWNRVDIQGGSALTSSVGIQLVGATGSYGETRQNDFNNMNIEDVKTAIELTDSSDNTFTNINYTRVLNGGTVFKLNNESHNNKFENTYLDSNTAGATFVLIDDSANDSAQPNIYSRMTGWSTGTTNINVTLTDSTILEHIALTGGDPILESELLNRIDRAVPSYITVASTTATSTINVLNVTGAFGFLGDYITNTATWFLSKLQAVTSAVLTGTWDFGGAAFLEIPNGTGNTADDVGEIAHDTTDNQLILDDYVIGRAVQKIWNTTVSSTSQAYIDAGLLPVPTEIDGYTITRIQCHVVGGVGTNKVIAVEDASGNSSEDITCATTNTTDDGSITNATYTASELSFIDFGTASGTPNYVSVSVFGTITRE